MASPPLNTALDKLESALSRLEQIPDHAPGLFDNAGPSATEASRNEALLADRDRTIAKLQADLADITKLKDQEIADLRAELVETADSRQADETSNAKYQRLRAAAEKTLAGIDRILAQTAKDGSHG